MSQQCAFSDGKASKKEVVVVLVVLPEGRTWF